MRCKIIGVVPFFHKVFIRREIQGLCLERMVMERQGAIYSKEEMMQAVREFSRQFMSVMCYKL